MSFVELPKKEQANLLRQYLGQYLSGIRRLRYLQSEIDSIPVLKAVKYTGMPRGTDTGDPTPAYVVKYNGALLRATQQQKKVLKIESDINDILELLDDNTRLVFEAVYLDGYSYDKLGAIIGESKRNIIRIINKGIDILLGNRSVVDALSMYYTGLSEAYLI